MRATDRLFWQQVQRRAAALRPEIQSAIVRAFAVLRDSLTDADVARLVASGNIASASLDTLLPVAVRDRAFFPIQQAIREGIATAMPAYARDLPKAAARGLVAGGFDILNPRILDAIRMLETRVMTTLTEGVRETTRVVVERALANGVGARTAARELRAVIGMAPNQLAAVQHFEEALRAGQFGKAKAYLLRDRRFDGVLKKGDPLTETQIGRMVEQYQKRMTAWNAETNARTAALDSQKLAQRLTRQTAIDKGYLPPNQMKRWSGTLDDRERPEHLAMEGQAVPFDEPFSNGQMIPGDSEFNCRCVAIYFSAREQSSL